NCCIVQYTNVKYTCKHAGDERVAILAANRLPEGERERRIKQLAALRKFLRDHGHTDAWLARQLARRYHANFSRQRLHSIWLGINVAPETFLADVCTIIGRKEAEVL